MIPADDWYLYSFCAECPARNNHLSGFLRRDTRFEFDDWTTLMDDIARRLETEAKFLKLVSFTYVGRTAPGDDAPGGFTKTPSLS